MYNYTGGWRVGKRNMKGECTWKDDEPHSMNCKEIIWTKGSTYTGMWNSDKYNGKGTHKDDKFEYSGYWVEGERSGQGMCTWIKGFDYKKGDCDDCDWKHDGTTYNGNWIKDMYDGEGEHTDKMYWYKGGWKNGAREGKGKCEWTRVGGVERTPTPGEVQKELGEQVEALPLLQRPTQYNMQPPVGALESLFIRVPLEG